LIRQLSRWWRGRAAAKALACYPQAAWDQAWAGLPLLAGLGPADASELQALAALFLRRKVIEEVQGVRLTAPEHLTIALQACLPILRLGLDWYRGWYAVIVYPREFVPEREWVDADGVVSVESEIKSGEAWQQGPVILSWADVESGTELDMRNGDANGHPPLHADMSDAAWARDLGSAYADLSRRVGRGEETPMDPYGAESPGEFFAVCSEAFFEVPHLLRDEYPRVYAQLADFYRQDPAARLDPV
jgi:Mlc titration factor MtfA (ptsG expression regulator)